VYDIAVDESELDSHLAIYGYKWQVHKMYLTAHYNMNDNEDRSVLLDTGVHGGNATVYGDPKSVQV